MMRTELKIVAGCVLACLVLAAAMRPAQAVLAEGAEAPGVLPMIDVPDREPGPGEYYAGIFRYSTAPVEPIGVSGGLPEPSSAVMAMTAAACLASRLTRRRAC